MEKEFKDIYYEIYNKNGISDIEKHSFKRTLKMLKMFGITIVGVLFFSKAFFIILPVFSIYIFIASSEK